MNSTKVILKREVPRVKRNSINLVSLLLYFPLLSLSNTREITRARERVRSVDIERVSSTIGIRS